MVNKILQP